MMGLRNLWRSGVTLQNCHKKVHQQCLKFSSSVKQKESKYKDLGDLRYQEATAFLANLSEEMKAKEKKIYNIMEMKRCENGKIPNELSVVDMQHLLTECHTIGSITRHLQFVWVNQMKCLSLKQKKARALEDRLSKPDLPEDFFKFSVPHNTRDTFIRKSAAVQTYMLGQPFIIDLDFAVTLREQKIARKQLSECYAHNYKHRQGFQLHFTSVSKNKVFKKELDAGLLEGYLVDFHEEPFWEIFPREKLVYLCPDAPKLKGYNGDDIFIMGGLVDIHDTSRVTYGRAKELGIRSGSLPMNDYLRFKDGATRALPLQHVMNVMLNVNLHGSWKKALVDTLPVSNHFVPHENWSDTSNNDRREHKRFRQISKNFSFS